MMAFGEGIVVPAVAIGGGEGGEGGAGVTMEDLGESHFDRQNIYNYVPDDGMQILRWRHLQSITKYIIVCVL